MSTELSCWSVADVSKFLSDLSLGDEVVSEFKKNGVNGKDLETLSVQELKDDLNLTDEQAITIEKGLQERRLKGEEPPLIQLDDEPPVLNQLAKQTSRVKRTEMPLEDQQAEKKEAESPQQLPPSVAKQTYQGSLKINEQVLREFTDLSTVIVQLESESVRMKLPIATSKLETLKSELKLEQEKLEDFAGKVLKQEGKVKKVEEAKWYPGKLIGKGKERQQKKVEGKKSKLIEAEENYALTVDDVQKLQTQVENTHTQVKELQHKVERLSAAEKAEKALVEKIFKGGFGDDKENLLEKELDALIPTLHRMQEFKSTYSRVNDLLLSALSQLKNAKETLSRSMGLSNIDVMNNLRGPPMRNTPGGFFVDAAKRHGVVQANHITKNASAMIMQAYNLLPQLPYINVEQVKRLDKAFLDILFDNVVTDLIMRAKIQENLKIVNRMEKDVEYGQKWTQEWLNGRITKDHNTVNKQCHDKKVELDKYRRHLIENAVKQSS